MYLELPSNLVGIDYVTGDIHGCYDQLMEKLEELDFNFELDRLFVCGDIIDRGPKSFEMVGLIGKPWFKAVRGNHEQWAIDNQRDLPFSQSARSHSSHGGWWFYSLDDQWMGIVASRLRTLPLMIETVVDGLTVGFAHAEPGDWDTTKHIIRHLTEADVTHDLTVNKLIWSRHRITHSINIPLKGIDHVFLGHTVVKQPTLLGNTTYIDTGAVFTEGCMTILTIKDYLNSIKT